MSDNVDFKIPKAEDVQKLVKDINDSQAMELDRNDIIFVGIIAGLQITRQWLNKKKILNRKRKNDQEAANSIKHNEFMKNIEKSGGSRVAWILGPTSYDAIRRSSDYFKKAGIGGTNHRYTTLAHDPLVGLMVGPINLLSNTITYNTEVSFGTSNVVPSNPQNPATGYQISRPSSFSSAFEKSIKAVQSNRSALPDAIIKHLLHLASDIGTTQGLVIPGLSLLPNIKGIPGSEVNAWLIKNKFDTVWFADAFLQFGLAELVNAVGSVIYKFLLYRNSTRSQAFIDTKCEKVIAIANAISSTEDVTVAMIRGLNGDPIGALRDLDWGGLIAAIKRMQQSSEFRDEVKGVVHVWDNLKFNASCTAESIETEFQNNIKNVDVKYKQIILQMRNEYAEYSRLESLSADLNASGQKMFDSSVDFADLNNASDVLRSKNEIDSFFKN